MGPTFTPLGFAVCGVALANSLSSPPRAPLDAQPDLTRFALGVGVTRRSYRPRRRPSAKGRTFGAMRQMHGLGAGEGLSSSDPHQSESEAMDDQEIDELLKRAEAGDAHAQNQVDEWIARALGPLLTTPPIVDVPRQGVVVGYDRLECCCGGA